MSKEDTIKCFLDCKGEDNGFQLTLTNKTIDVIANEIERLNNIIKELEEWLKQEYAVAKANSIQEPNNPEWYIKWNERKNTLDKLQELKRNSKEL